MTSRSRFTVTACTTCLLLILLAGCKTAPTTPRDLLDSRTGSTVTTAAEPLLFVRVRGEAPSITHDYVQLLATETDRAGQYADYLLMYQWSQEDQSAKPLSDNIGKLSITTDGRLYQLEPLSEVPPDLGARSALFSPGKAHFISRAYPIDSGTLQAMATSHNISVQLPNDPSGMPYLLWRDGRPALVQYLKLTAGN